MNTSDPQPVRFALRFSPEHLRLIDRARRLLEDPDGGPVTRSAAARYLLELGAATLPAKRGKGR